MNIATEKTSKTCTEIVEDLGLPIIKVKGDLRKLLINNNRNNQSKETTASNMQELGSKLITTAMGKLNDKVPSCLLSSIHDTQIKSSSNLSNKKI